MQIQNHSKVLLLDGPMGVGSGQIPKMTVIGDRTYILDYAAIIALDKSGNLDTTFDTDGIAYVSPDGIRPYAIQSNAGKLTVLGVAKNSYPNELHKSIAFDATGRTGAAVSTATLNELSGRSAGVVTTDKDGYIYIAGDEGIARLTGTGSISASYSTNATASVKPGSYIDNLTADSQGRLYVTAVRLVQADYATNTPSSSVLELFRLSADGTLDTSFGQSGYVSLQGYGGAPALSVTDAGDILIGLSGGDASVARVTSQGIKDTAFGKNGVATIDLNGVQAGEYVCDIVVDGDIAIAVIASYPNHKVTLVPINKTGFAPANSLLLAQKSIGDGTDAVIDTANKLIKLAVPTWESQGIETFTVSYADIVNGTSAGNVYTGTASNDHFTSTSGNDSFVGGAGLDVVTYNNFKSNFAISKTSTGFLVVDTTLADGMDHLVGVERIKFVGSAVALDVESNAGQAYRLYQAAFNRAPDKGGLGFQMNELDIGLSLSQVAQNFINSPEFSRTYGSLDDTQFVTQLYQNVLHRAPDAGGLSFHVTNLSRGVSRADTLVGFSESPENQTALIGVIENGMEYVPVV